MGQSGEAFEWSQRNLSPPVSSGIKLGWGAQSPWHFTAGQSFVEGLGVISRLTITWLHLLV